MHTGPAESMEGQERRDDDQVDDDKDDNDKKDEVGEGGKREPPNDPVAVDDDDSGSYESSAPGIGLPARFKNKKYARAAPMSGRPSKVKKKTKDSLVGGSKDPHERYQEALARAEGSSRSSGAMVRTILARQIASKKEQIVNLQEMVQDYEKLAELESWAHDLGNMIEEEDDKEERDPE